MFNAIKPTHAPASVVASDDDIVLVLSSDTKILTFHRNFLEITTLDNWQKTRVDSQGVCCPSIKIVPTEDPGLAFRFRESRVIPRFEFAGATLTRENNKDKQFNVSAAEVRVPREPTRVVSCDLKAEERI
jgi:hypothetical protein